MAHVIAIANQKGGVGKSTTSEALAEGLNRKGWKTLIIDLDPQGSLSLAAGVAHGVPTSYDVLTRLVDVADAIQYREGRADIIPADSNLARLDVEMITTGKEYRLKEQIKPLLSDYSYIILDTPPALGVLTVNALTAANSLIVPVQADVFSLQGLGQLNETISVIQEYTNPNLVLSGVLLTRHNGRSILSRDMTDAARAAAEKIGTYLCKAAIREGVAIKEAQANQLPIYDYAPRSNVAADYMEFVEEFINRGL